MTRGAALVLWLALAAPAQEPAPAQEGAEAAPRSAGDARAQEVPPAAEPGRAPPPAQPPATDAGAKAEPATDAGAAPSLEAITGALQALAAEHAGRVRVETLATSPEGRAVELVVVGPGGEASDRDVPGLLVVGELGGGEAAGGWSAAAALALARRLAQEPSWNASAYVVPVLDPDARATGAAEPSALAADFPAGWTRGRSAIPLARPESLALARFLAEHPNLVLVVAPWTGPVAGTSAGAPALAAADRGACAALLDALGTARAGLRTLDSARGSILDFAYLAQGVLALGCAPRADAGAGSEAEARAGELLALARELPRLALEAGTPEAASSSVWQVDVRVANASALATESALSAAGRADRGVVLAVRGARLIASALREGDEGPFRLASAAGAGEGRVRVGRLPGRGATTVRLLLEAPGGAEVALEARGASAGVAAGTLVLR